MGILNRFKKGAVKNRKIRFSQPLFLHSKSSFFVTVQTPAS